MTSDQAQLLVSFGACGVAMPIIVIEELRRVKFEQRLADWWHGRRRPPQRKADESAARAACRPRPRLGIDVSPIACPVKDEPLERVCDVIQRGAA